MEIKSNVRKKGKYTIAVGLDTEKKEIRFFVQTKGTGSSMEEVSHKTNAFSKEFYKELLIILENYVKKHPSALEADVLFVLPDRLIAMDALNVPTMMRRKKTEEGLDMLLESLYRKKDELNIQTVQVTQNKRQTLYGVNILRQDVIEQLEYCCTNAKLNLSGVTFASACTVGAVGQMNSHLKNSNYLLMDVKADYTRITFVVKGRAAGYFRLPFGSSSLHHRRLAAEDLLMEHPVAELAVLNAKEKARAKQLTMMREDEMTETITADGMDTEGGAIEVGSDSYEEEAALGEDDVVDTSSALVEPVTTKVLPKKTARKLPKFMLRPQPESEQEYLNENFRLFVKWALNLIADNDKIKMQGMPEAVYVRIAQQYHPLLDVVNEEKDENGIEFKALDLHSSNEEITGHLELYGGVLPSAVHKSCLF